MVKTNIIFLIFIGFFLVVGISFLALHFFKKKEERAAKVADSSPETAPTAVVFGDAFEAVALLGKTAEESGVNEKCFTTGAGSRELKFDCSLFSKPASGTLLFSGEGESAASLYLRSAAFDFETLKHLLAGRFGEPEREWELPYAEVNGGAQCGAAFSLENGIGAQLTQGSEQNFVLLRFQKH